MNTALTIGVALISLITLITLIWQKLKVQKQPDEKSYQLLYSAYQKVKAILGNAELEAVKITADSRLQTRKIEEKYEQEFAKLRSDLEISLNDQVSLTLEEYKKFLQNLEDLSQQTQLANQQVFQQKTNQVFETFEQNLTTFLSSAQNQSSQALELELKSARNLIDTYKASQLRIVDENIVAVLEKTISLVITQRLSLKDHMDLVFEALEKAKVEKFIV